MQTWKEGDEIIEKPENKIARERERERERDGDREWERGRERHERGIDSMFTQCQFARVVKGVDLRSTAGNCAWVRTPQLTIFVCISFSLSFFLLSSSVRHLCLSPSPPVSLSYDLKLETLRNMVCAKKLEHLTVADFLRCCISWVKSDMIEELALTLILTLIPTSNILRLMFQ